MILTLGPLSFAWGTDAEARLVARVVALRSANIDLALGVVRAEQTNTALRAQLVDLRARHLRLVEMAGAALVAEAEAQSPP